MGRLSYGDRFFLHGERAVVGLHGWFPQALRHAAVGSTAIIPAEARAGHLFQPIVEVDPAEVVKVGAGQRYLRPRNPLAKAIRFVPLLQARDRRLVCPSRS